MRPHIRVYPEKTDSGMQEVWHGNKWLYEIDRDLLSPMYDAGGGRHYYVNELAQLADGSFIIPFLWFTYKGEVYADSWTVTINTMVSLFEK